MEIILASASPRRVELIKRIEGLEVKVIPSTADENVFEENPYELVRTLAHLKANEVFGKHGGKVIGADTVVVDGNRVLGKPKNESEAESMLISLCGKTHKVLTGVCLIKEGGYITEVCETLVTFRPYDKKTVDAYLKTGSPMDKAGAYGIQDKELSPLIEKVDGDINNVIGFPVSVVDEMIKSFFKTKGEN